MIAARKFNALTTVLTWECTLFNKEKSVVAKCVYEYGYGGLDCSQKVCLKDITGRQSVDRLC